MIIEITHEITQRLNNAFNVQSLEVIDDSYMHVGHSKPEGSGHFTVKIKDDSAFKGLSVVDQHRKVFAALGDLMEYKVHALNIIIL